RENALQVPLLAEVYHHRRAVVISQQQRQVGRVLRRRREGHRADAEVLDTLQALREAVRFRRKNDGCAGTQRFGTDVLRVTDDDRRAVTQLQQIVSCGLDRDDDRVVLTQEEA